MILDPDEPLAQHRTERQSLILTTRGWAVLGQPTPEIEAEFKRMTAEMTELCPDADVRGVTAVASQFAFDLAPNLIGRA